MKVLVSVTNTGNIHKTVVFALMRLMQDQRHDVHIILPTHNPYEHSLNRIVKDAIEQNYDYWINIDSDNPPLNNVLDLVGMHCDVIGCPTPIFRNETPEHTPVTHNIMRAEKRYMVRTDKSDRQCSSCSNKPAVGLFAWAEDIDRTKRDIGPGVAVFAYCEDCIPFETIGWQPYPNQPNDALVEVDAVGSGCMVVRVELLAAMRKKWKQPIFERTTNDWGIVEYGPDFNFCRKVQLLGRKVYAHFDYWCEHIQTLPLMEASNAISYHGTGAYRAG